MAEEDKDTKGAPAPVEKNGVKEKLLHKFTMVLTRNFTQGVQGDMAKLKQAVNEFYFFRTKINELSTDGYVALYGVMQVFTGQIKPQQLKLDEEPELQTILQNVAETTQLLLKTVTESVGENLTPESTFLECSSFLILLASVVLVDEDPEYLQQSYEAMVAVWNKLKKMNRRSSDFVAAKVCFYRVLFHSKLSLPNPEIRSDLLEDYRTCVLNHNEPCQAVITNLILQKYLEDTLITQAEKFVTKATLPDRVDPYQLSRYCYYVGRINVIQLQYGDALKNFRQSLRKAPQYSAVGFKQIVSKYFIVTMLLMGEIPERSIFRQEGLTNSLKPYFQLTQAVRVGDMSMFQETMDQFADVFERDKVYMLITRLSHNVIKAALRKISISYSRIRLVDVAKKLGLDSALEAEYIVGKAIRDGVIDAVIDHRAQVMRSTEISSVYSTVEPQLQLDKRVQYTLSLYQQCVKALRHEEEPDEDKKETEEPHQSVEQLVQEILSRTEQDDE